MMPATFFVLGAWVDKYPESVPTLFRPPYGDYDNRVVATVESIDMYTIQWDCDVSATVGKVHKYRDFSDSKLQKNNKF